MPDENGFATGSGIRIGPRARCGSRGALAALVLSLAACTRVVEESVAPAPEPPAVVGDVRGLTLELRAPQHEVLLGGFTDLEAFLVNTGSRPVTAVLPGDGSEAGWRTPVVRWDPPPTHPLRCGNINPASMDELVVLQPGERVALAWIGRPSFDGPGTYTVALELEHDPELEWKGVPLGAHPPGFMKRLRRIEPYRVRSNPVELRVID